MSYIAIETATETMLKTAFQAALTAAELTGTVYGWWLDDNPTGDSEDVVFPQINIQAFPNEPLGYRQPVCVVPVTVDIITFQPKDRKRAAVIALYGAIRKSVDEDDFSSASFSDVTISVEPGSDVVDDGRIQFIRLTLGVQVCTGQQDIV